MARSKADGKLFNALAIRDTAAHDSSSIDNALSGNVLVLIENGLDQTVVVKLQGSFNDSTWTDLPGSESVATTAKAAITLSDPWPKVRAVATCAVQPTTGTLTAWWAWREAV